MGKKVSVNVEQTVDGGFKIDTSTGMWTGQTKVAETLDTLVQKVTAFLREQYGEK